MATGAEYTSPSPTKTGLPGRIPRFAATEKNEARPVGDTGVTAECGERWSAGKIGVAVERGKT